MVRHRNAVLVGIRRRVHGQNRSGLCFLIIEGGHHVRRIGCGDRGAVKRDVLLRRATGFVDVAVCTDAYALDLGRIGGVGGDAHVAFEVVGGIVWVCAAIVHREGGTRVQQATAWATQLLDHADVAGLVRVVRLDTDIGHSRSSTLRIILQADGVGAIGVRLNLLAINPDIAAVEANALGLGIGKARQGLEHAIALDWDVVKARIAGDFIPSARGLDRGLLTVIGGQTT